MPDVHTQIRRIFEFLLAASPLLCCAGADAEGDVNFARDVRPLLSNTCFKCHGPDEDGREADLRLDTQEGAYADLGGYQAINPKNPDASVLVERITHSDPDLRMPPPSSGLKLSPAQIELLKAWIKEGGTYDLHWSFRPILRPEVPVEDTAAMHNPIDAFVLKRLQDAGLTLASEADRSTLIRRVYLDLLGLPPDPIDLAEFLADDRPGAYDRMVDGVLANPHYGERWGRHWLDQARYADTNGYTVDSERSMWPYRDWVIQAINSDLSFNDFTIEQIAGDLLPSPSQEQLVATGFHRNTLINQEGGTDNEQFRNEAVVDRVNTTGAVWLGLTVGCAQCHTHKFDPLTQREFYQLFAFFNSSQDVNSVAPTVTVASEMHQEKLKELDAKITEAKAAIAAYEQAINDRAPAAERDDGQPVHWEVITVESANSAAGATFERLGDGSLVVGGVNADHDTYSITFSPPFERLTAVRLETLTHPSLPKGGPGRAGNGNFVLNQIALAVGESNASWLHALADHSQKDYDVTSAIDDNPATGWAINVSSGNANVNRTAEFVLSPLETHSDALAAVTLTFGETPAKYNIGRFRLSVTAAPHAKLNLPDAGKAQLAANLKTLQDERARFAKNLPNAMIMRELEKPRESHVLIRGDFLRKGEAVHADSPAFLPQMADRKQAHNRLDLARWLVNDKNPLTARVTVNRVWGRLFGQGIVETENDFGLQGTPPTHPQLLDWLSSDWMANGWSLKQLHRTIVSSATYRQSSRLRVDAERIDPLNKLISRQARLRVDAEIVRDLALSVSGLLDHRIGGASVYPPQPNGVYAFTQRNASWPTSKGADRYRRGLYTFFMRSAPYPMLTTFDTPRFNTTCTMRARSNTPLQSLTLANDETMLDNSRALGRRLMDQESSDTERIKLAYQICFARVPIQGELDRLLTFVAAQKTSFLADPEGAKAITQMQTGGDKQLAERAAWTIVSRALLNLDEFITRE
ncbi:MAG: PSD1 domain-containing protein [Planctomycetaceae bacterium]|nr:PSD1 domain-containing protein [Planctomycetales bacterium]MCB9926311.1 PSD1 domain-containing protein [Planctomycetaceae bacterium]